MPAPRVLTISSDGILLRIHVTPGANTTEFPTGYDEWRHAITARLHAPAQENKANDELLSVLASFFHLQPQDLSITAGHSSRDKTVLLKRITKPQLLKKLKDAGYDLPTDP